MQFSWSRSPQPHGANLLSDRIKDFSEKWWAWRSLDSSIWVGVALYFAPSAARAEGDSESIYHTRAKGAPAVTHSSNPIKDNFIVYLFDRSGVVKTKRINIHEQKKEFLRMAIGVLFVDEIYLGCDPTIKKRGGHWYLTVEQPDRTPAELEIIEMIFRREGIRCKGTTVWLVQGRIMSGEDEEGTVEESYIVT